MINPKKSYKHISDVILFGFISLMSWMFANLIYWLVSNHEVPKSIYITMYVLMVAFIGIAFVTADKFFLAIIFTFVGSEKYNKNISDVILFGFISLMSWMFANLIYWLVSNHEVPKSIYITMYTLMVALIGIGVATLCKCFLKIMITFTPNRRHDKLDQV